MDLSSFSFILEEMAVCRDCEVGKLELFDRGTKASCASLLMIRCKKCYISKSFWSVSGKFGKKKLSLPEGDTHISKRNDMVYSSVLGARLVGLGNEKLKLYHASLIFHLLRLEQLLYLFNVIYS